MNVLVVGAHAFETLFLVGGTIARLAADGHRVALAVSCAPHPGGAAAPQEAADRQEESRRATSLIGATPYLLGFTADALRGGAEAPQSQLCEVFRQTAPRLILTHDPVDCSEEHTLTSQLASRCHSIVKRDGASDQSAGPSAIVFMDTLSGLGFEPEQFVDITEFYATKREMLMCFRSKLERKPDDQSPPWMEWLEVHSRFRGIQSGVGFAEAFRRPVVWGSMSPERLLP
ncbi:MAG: PIG-L deacetylase family protein [Armatimonadota bacterium]